MTLTNLGKELKKEKCTDDIAIIVTEAVPTPITNLKGELPLFQLSVHFSDKRVQFCQYEKLEDVKTDAEVVQTRLQEQYGCKATILYRI